ncbi:SLC13 family permease [Desulfobacter vibrioformis]|uniref:SLC13 family permease n=1 Tax=Desulfobacter vibrioformis TaxID=34031 RepID=UPI0005582F18|nr:SLC13 family permease [Desulfobacter vibrioformis]
MTGPNSPARPGPASYVTAKPLVWALAIVLPFALFFYLFHLGVARDTAIFIAIVSLTLLSWMFSLTADFIPGLFALLLLLLFGLVPNRVALSGFSSNGFLIAFSVMGLGAVISTSGLARRYTLWLIQILPQNSLAYQMAVFFTGFLLNPVVPTITARAVMVCPIMNRMSDHMDEKTRNRTATQMYLAGLDGINLLSPVFLTAAPANLMVFGLFPVQEQFTFQFTYWCFAASIAGAIILGAYFLVSALFFKGWHRIEMDQADIKAQWQEMPAMSGAEWAALASIILLTLGIVTAPWHKIPIPLIAFSIICFLLVFGALDRKAFIEKIDWPFLFLLAAMIGVMASMNHMGLDKALVARFDTFKTFMRMDFEKFVLVLSSITLLVRLFIPLNSAILILAAAFLPLASGAGISPWAVGFIILIMSETAFFGFQSPYILFFRSQVAGHVPYSEPRVQLFHGILVLVKLGAIYASIPFWRSIGVL